MNAATKKPEVSLKGVAIGQCIPENLSYHLKKYTTQGDRAIVSQKTGVGFHTVDKLVQGSNTVTKSNQIAVMEIVKLTLIKIDNEINDAKISKRTLKSILKK